MPQGEFGRIWKRKEADETTVLNILINVGIMVFALVLLLLKEKI